MQVPVRRKLSSGYSDWLRGDLCLNDFTTLSMHVLSIVCVGLLQLGLMTTDCTALEGFLVAR